VDEIFPPSEAANHPSGQLILDTLRVEDLPALMEIEHRSFSAPWSEATYRHEIASNPMAFYYAIRPPLAPPTDAQPPSTEPDALNTEPLNTEYSLLAYGGFWLPGDEAHIVTIASHYNLRRRGLGETMLLLLLHQAQSMGAAHATLEVRPSNTSALALYQKWGFEEVGRRKRYYRDNMEDALIYTLHNLNNPVIFAPITNALGKRAAWPDLS
jgi:ribosomal-protein-alanine N-acetyltransferase